MKKPLFPRHILLASLILCLLPANVLAQTKMQRGIARMITRTAADPIVPVQGVEVVVGNAASKASDKNGRFTLNVTASRDGSYTLAAVRLPKNSKLVLASPSKGKRLYLSKNDLAVTFITTEDRNAVSRATYKKLLSKYNAQAEHLRKLRRELTEKKSELDANSAEYAKVTAECDSVQKLLNIYFDEKTREQTLKELEKISDDLAVTDYQSLDSLQARIYELKMEGDWATISSLLHDLMGGDAAGWMQRKTDLKDKTEAELAQSIRLTRAALESYREQGQNDSVSHYYELLIDVDPTDFKTIEEAALFEWRQCSNKPQALEYLQKALDVCSSAQGDHAEDIARLRSELDEINKH